MVELEGKVAIVTGAGRYNGIGRYIALALAKNGADVVVTGSGRSPDSFPEDEKEIGWRDIDSVADEIRELGRKALPLVTNMLDPDDAKRLAEETKRELGRIDILVNNAAAGRGNDRVPVLQIPDDEWRRVVDMNLTGTFYVTKAVGNAIVEQGEGGRIINISSVAGRRGMPTYGSYAASKAGVIMLTQVLASELASQGINVNCVCPGLVGTHRMQDVVKPGPMRDAVMGQIPLGREGYPEEIGEMVAFLAGPRAAYVHGQTFNVDGGIVMR